jgi:acyl-CoA thioesterase-1
MRLPRSWLVRVLVASLALGCGAESPPASSSRASPSSGSVTADDTTTLQGPLVTFLGDSITAGLHLPKDEAFPAVLGRQLAAVGTPIRIVNAGVSGGTSAGGLRQLDWQLRQEPAVVVVELGGNDALRGQGLESIEQNLREIIQACLDRGARVLLLGMRIPNSYGLDYATSFSALYQTLSDELDVPWVPFFMEPAVKGRGLMMSDGIHPTRAGHEALAEHVLPALQLLLSELPAP